MNLTNHSVAASDGGSADELPRRICLWSGPRNVSTALMYSFAQRSDTRVVDEPLYAHYLRVSGAEHPGREEVLATMENDGEKVVRELILGECDRPVLFMKQMAHHLVDIDREFLKQTVNVVLMRDPVQVLPSLARNLTRITLRDTGLGMQTELLDQLRAWGQDPPVLDSREVLLDPRGVLGELCARLGIPFEEAMLQWPAGPNPADGSWAPYWYDNVHRSTGFMSYDEKTRPFPEPLKAVLEECRPHYERLRTFAIKAPSPSEKKKTAETDG